MTKMTTRLQRIEELIRPLEAERLERWVRSLSDEELMRYVTDKTKAELESLKTLSTEQLLYLYNGEPLSVVLSQERKSA
jgi:hypothetical protein